MISGLAILMLQTQLLGNMIQDELNGVDNITISETDFQSNNDKDFLDKKNKLGNLIQKASAKELGYILYRPQKQIHIDFFLYVCSDWLSVDQYIDFIFELSKTPNENISEDTWRKILFPGYRNNEILAYNYRDPRVISSLIAITAAIKNPSMVEAIKDIQQGISLKKSLSYKIEGYHDNFNILPIKSNDAYSNAIKLMAMRVALYDIKVLIEQAQKENPSSKESNDFAALKNALSSSDDNFSMEDILNNSAFIFAKDASPEFSIDKRDIFVKVIANSEAIIIQQVNMEKISEIQEMYMDIIYLSISDFNDWCNFLSLLKNANKCIRQYVYNKIKYVGQIDLDSPLTQAAIDFLAKKYQLFKENSKN